MDNYTFGRCKYCGKDKALNNEVCNECFNEIKLPDFMQNLFRGFKDENINS